MADSYIQYTKVDTQEKINIKVQDNGDGTYSFDSGGGGGGINVAVPQLAIVREGGVDANIVLEMFDIDGKNLIITDAPGVESALTITATPKSITTYNSDYSLGADFDGVHPDAVGACFTVASGAVRFNFGGTVNGAPGDANGIEVAGGEPTASASGRAVAGQRVCWGRTPYN